MFGWKLTLLSPVVASAIWLGLVGHIHASEKPAQPREQGSAAGSVNQARYEADLRFISKPRPPGSRHWKAVQDMCVSRLRGYGYDVSIPTYAHNDTSQNVVGIKRGTKSPNTLVVLSAHYDSTDRSCPGADDNATGTAALLESARVLSSTNHDRTLVLACWDEEERGLIGSQAFARAAADNKQAKIAMMYGYEMIGFTAKKPGAQKIPFGFGLVFPDQVAALKKRGNPGDFITLVYDNNPLPEQAAQAFVAAAGKIDLPVIALPVLNTLKNTWAMKQLRRSDHAAFWSYNLPGMMITDSSNFRNPNYHCLNGTNDSVDTLDHGFSTKVIRATVASVKQMLRD
ncbi:MAG: M28 family peptidase [Pseudomonadota bacterium]